MKKTGCLLLTLALALGAFAPARAIQVSATVTKALKIGQSTAEYPVATLSDKRVQEAINADIRTMVEKAAEYLGASSEKDADTVNIRFLSMSAGEYFSCVFQYELLSAEPYPTSGVFTLNYRLADGARVRLSETADTDALAFTICAAGDRLIPLTADGSALDSEIWKAQKEYLKTYYPKETLAAMLKNADFPTRVTPVDTAQTCVSGAWFPDVFALYNRYGLSALTLPVPHEIGDTMMFAVPGVEKPAPTSGVGVGEN